VSQGRRIVEEEQNGQAGSVYGDHLLTSLSEDLSATLGSGFSERNLYNMRQFYLTHEISQAPAKLTWTQHVELLRIKTPGKRRKLERLIITKKLSKKQIRHCWTRDWRRRGSREWQKKSCWLSIFSLFRFALVVGCCLAKEACMGRGLCVTREEAG
jgi:hypothetical protein